MKPMKKTEYQNIIDQLGLSQVAAGRFLEIGERTSRRYASGASPIPGPTAILLRLMISDKLDAEHVTTRAEERVA